MSDLGGQIIYKQLLDRHLRIRIPMIQRDYAQGRDDQKEVREEFLGALAGALARPVGDSSLPLNLDFVYGSVEGQKETCFSPLDGQQRLTTLFLLHWYLAWTDDRWDDFRDMFQTDGRSRFSYSVRPSSTEFFDELVAYRPKCPCGGDQPSRLVTDQPWYFRSWRLDPTIQGTLVVLDEIHRRFAASHGLFERLTSVSNPAITFQLLDLDNFGLSDDLYIKMNARGKPLTPFETFKARYEQELEKQFSGEWRPIGNQEFPIANFVARRMDTAWSDLFWAHRDKKTNLYDSAIMNLCRAIALVTRNPESDKYAEDVSLLRNSWNPPSYSTFYSQGWLDRDFTQTLISLLESWSATDGFSKPLLPDSRYFDEKKTFERLIQNPTGLTLPEVVQFSGYTLFITAHEQQSLDPDSFQEWMRVVHNLVVNSNIERPDQLRSSARGVRELLPKSRDILRHFSRLTAKDRVTGFNDQQVKEEALKAGLILSHNSWRPLIDRAEGHGYFRGQIEFLLDFSGVMAVATEKEQLDWGDDQHLSLHARFEGYLKKAETMFGPAGLKDSGTHRWQRALLTIGDYLLPSGTQNVSFLVNSSTDPASWKRLLRGTGTKAAESRKILHQLWDRLKEDGAVEEQLRGIISGSSVEHAWRRALVQTPAALDYCGNGAIRWNAPEEVYLLKKSQMNGAHAELFTFCFYNRVLLPLSKQTQLAPLVLREYQSVNGTLLEPRILLAFAHEGHQSSIKVEFKKGSFVISIDCERLLDQPNVEAVLLDSLGFVRSDGRMLTTVGPTAIKSTMLALVKACVKQASPVSLSL